MLFGAVSYSLLIGIDEREAQQFLGEVSVRGHFLPNPQQFIIQPTI
jgi:hypothetical protein